jgi:hypothetical protein
MSLFPWLGFAGYHRLRGMSLVADLHNVEHGYVTLPHLSHLEKRAEDRTRH